MGLRTTKRTASGYIDAAGKLVSFFRTKLIGSASNPPKDRGIQASGGAITEYAEGGFFWRAHVFTTSGALTIEGIPGEYGNTVEYLVVGGGGGGNTPGFGAVPHPPSPGGTGPYGAGGGGAGGLRSNSPTISVSNGLAFPVSVTSYPIIVGAGGALATNGNPSVFNNPGVENSTKFTSTGGGYGGGATNSRSGQPGGSGGGASSTQNGGTGNTPPTSPAQGTSATPGVNVPNPGAYFSTPGASILPTGGLTSGFDGRSIVYSAGGGSGSPVGGSPSTGGGGYGPASSGTGSDGVVIVRYKISQ